MNITGLNPAASFYAPSAISRSTASAAAGKSAPAGDKAASGAKLSSQDQDEVRKLKARDQEVRQHEQAHLAAAGGLATSGASYTYQRGPDGVNYAVGGEVSIDTSGGKTPEETLRRAETIRAAALAPADPSGQDRAVAAQAAKMEQQANAEIAQQRTEQATSTGREGGKAGQASAVERFYGGKPAANAGNSLNTYA